MSVDWDLLADHLGGALAGAPESARVEHLIETDPEWAAAARALSDAVAAVTAELDPLRSPVPMPPEVADRLNAALVALPVHSAGAPGEPGAAFSTGSAGDLTPADRGGISAGEGPERSGHMAAVPPPRRGSRRAGQARPSGSPRPRTRARRMGRWGAGLAVAAGLVAFTGFGVQNWLGPWSAADDGRTVAEADQPLQAPAPADGVTEEPPLTASGSDYSTDPHRLAPPDAAEASPRSPERDRDSRQEEGPGAEDQEDPAIASAPGLSAVPAALQRLWEDSDARTECLSLVAGEAGQVAAPPVTLAVADFAHFRGEPALVIWVTGGDGAEWVWVVGPACGIPAAGLDERFQLQLS